MASDDPCVIITTSGMLNGGPVFDYLNNLAADEKNALVFVGYQADGTLGRRIQKGWREVPLGRRESIVINLEVITVDGFSGHSDRRQLMNYVGHVRRTPRRSSRSTATRRRPSTWPRRSTSATGSRPTRR